MNYYGGVLFGGGYLNITITDSKFTNNSARYLGGVLYLFYSDHSNITITDSEFTDNSASIFDGGVLYLSFSNHSSITIMTVNSLKIV